MEECYKIENRNRCHYINGEIWAFLENHIDVATDKICGMFINDNEEYKEFFEHFINIVHLNIKKYVINNKPEVIHKCDEKFVMTLSIPHQYGMYNLVIHLFHETGKRQFHTNMLVDTPITIEWKGNKLDVTNTIEVSCNELYSNLHDNLCKRLKPHLQRLYYNYILFNNISDEWAYSIDDKTNIDIINEAFVIDDMYITEDNEISKDDTLIDYFNGSNLKRYIERYLKLLKYIFTVNMMTQNKYNIDIQNIVNMSFNSINIHINDFEHNFNRRIDEYDNIVPYIKDVDIDSCYPFLGWGYGNRKQYEDIEIDNGLSKMYNPFPEDMYDRIRAFRDMLQSDVPINREQNLPFRHCLL